MSDWAHNTPGVVDWVMGACMLVRREAIEDAGLLDEKFVLYFEDQDWCYRMWQKGWEVWYVPQVEMIHYHQRESKRWFSKHRWIHLKSMVRFFGKHNPREVSRFSERIRLLG